MSCDAIIEQQWVATGLAIAQGQSGVSVTCVCVVSWGLDCKTFGQNAVVVPVRKVWPL